MVDPFVSSRGCLSRGKDHIVDLDEQILAFYKTQPATIIVEADPDGIHELYKPTLTKPIPDGLMNVAADAVINLRSALDQAVYATLGVRKKVRRRQAKFPVADSESEFKTGTVFQYFPDDIKPLFKSFEPYIGGNNLLWALNRICNTNKHQILIPVCFFQGPVEISTEQIAGDKIVPLPGWDGAKYETIFTKTSPNADYHINCHIVVAFNEVEVVKGKPIIATLNKMAVMVEQILLAIETEARRLGYV
ncbi:MAG: hypothetical protein ACLP5H_30670 [Desulfomonilaceae bacterium]